MWNVRRHNHDLPFANGHFFFINNQGRCPLDVVFIEWKGVIFISGMLSLRKVLDRSGVSRLLAKALWVHWGLSARMRCCNVLVMGPCGYRFIDYLKVDVLLSLIVLMVLMVIMPIFRPLSP
jgi:di/tricarboxylate transporter